MVILSKKSSLNQKKTPKPYQLLKNGLFEPATTKPFKNPNWISFIGSKRKWKNIKSISSGASSDPLSSPWLSIEALPSLHPQLKYCDITGLEMMYIDPKSGLRFSSTESYQYIKKLSPNQVQDYLALRNASFIMK